MVSLVKWKPSIDLGIRSLVRRSLESFPSSYISQDDVSQDTILTFLVFSKAEFLLLCINKVFPNHLPVSPTMTLQLPHYQDRWAKRQTWRSHGSHKDQQEAAGIRPASDPTNTGNHEPC